MMVRQEVTRDLAGEIERQKLANELLLSELEASLRTLRALVDRPVEPER